MIALHRRFAFALMVVALAGPGVGSASHGSYHFCSAGGFVAGVVGPNCSTYDVCAKATCYASAYGLLDGGLLYQGNTMIRGYTTMRLRVVVTGPTGYSRESTCSLTPLDTNPYAYCLANSGGEVTVSLGATISATCSVSGAGSAGVSCRALMNQ